MLVLEDDYLTFAVVEVMCMRYLYDFMQEDLKDVGTVMLVITTIISMHDPELYKFLLDANWDPRICCISWFMAWF